MGLALAIPLARAAGEVDPVDELAGRVLRASGATVPLSGRPPDPLALAAAVGPLRPPPGWNADAAAAVRLAVDPELLLLEQGRGALEPLTIVRGWTRVVEGDGRTWRIEGDPEDGWLGLRVGADAAARTSWWEAAAGAEMRVNAVGATEIAPALDRAWAGYRHGPVRAGFGLEPRSFGPARHGNLVLGDDARSFPAGSLEVQHAVPRVGTLRLDTGAGWLQAPRDDVDHPGILWMDLRWVPRGWLEVGATRAALFAGEGRPWPGIGPLLLPLDPHVEDDPDQELPDQDEEAALDARLCLPMPGPVDTIELYTQYGGDDMIVRHQGPVDLPALAGVANLYGGELGAGPAVVTVEYVRILDDRFRWYTGHRVYHDGFTQDGRVIGYPAGGDQQTWFGRTGWTPGPWGVDAWGEHTWRVSVADVAAGSVIALPVPEVRVRGGVRGFWTRAQGGSWSAGIEVERVTGDGFVPGATATHHRVWVEYRGVAWRG